MFAGGKASPLSSLPSPPARKSVTWSDARPRSGILRTFAAAKPEGVLVPRKWLRASISFSPSVREYVPYHQPPFLLRFRSDTGEMQLVELLKFRRLNLLDF
ncbi:hypothetical protein Taro_022191 [Colocasia esculenta]|uniref:Uncharacterized protein n=1 Tax=Colocasia esculenta TaxID=4460 RepID=A0A843VAL1_COLES|nr:hypothetical protein [Colocasia esculenta]